MLYRENDIQLQILQRGKKKETRPKPFLDTSGDKKNQSLLSYYHGSKK